MAHTSTKQTEGQTPSVQPAGCRRYEIPLLVDTRGASVENVRGKNSIHRQINAVYREGPPCHLLNRREFLTGAAAVVGAAGIRYPIWALAGPSSAGNLLLGVDYYPDQTPEALWEKDARMMAEVGFTNVRIAEFAWALMEPVEGRFDFAWLRRSVDILHKHNIAVILGTPSAAPPPWLTAKIPTSSKKTKRASGCIPEDDDLPVPPTRFIGGCH